ncbi:MAG: hypothetical protein IPN17_02480, partial [Deltaproteobacteria bacterium]|nr:hypothetical protein [Deltaproteobacteria bacterium]
MAATLSDPPTTTTAIPAATRRHPARPRISRWIRAALRLLCSRSMAPSTVHESLLLWLRDDPSQLSTLLGLLGHEPCPTTLTVEDSALRVAFPVEVTP